MMHVAAADSFGGFSGVRSAYLVSPDHVCTPLAVSDGEAKGAPSCSKATADVIAQLSIKNAKDERGSDARFTAHAQGNAVVVHRRDGDSDVVRYTSFDPVVRIGAVYAAAANVSDASMVVVEVVVRRAGREATDLIGFTFGHQSAAIPTTIAPPIDEPPTEVAPVDAALTGLLTKARAAHGKAAAWRAVLTADHDNAEATYNLALSQLHDKQTAAALTSLETLAASKRGDAIEWLVMARFEPAFHSLANDGRFRKAVGFDHPGTSVYERAMGHGGKWEQAGTSCAAPSVALALTQSRSFDIEIRTVCEGQKDTSSFRGKWAIDGANLVLRMPPLPGKKATPGKSDDDIECTLGRAGDEDQLHCVIDQDLDFTVLPTRR